MRVVKRLNNNAAVCIDNDGREIIAFGLGIGFGQLPYELSDLKKIERTFYDIDKYHLDLLNDMDEDVFKISAEIVDYASDILDGNYTSNFIFALADHINFLVENYKKGIDSNSMFNYDIEYYYEKEKEVGEKAIHYINRKLNLNVPLSQSIGIALHFINADKNFNTMKKNYNEDKIIETITLIIEQRIGIKIQKGQFNYYRFATHMRHLIERLDNRNLMESKNSSLFKSIKEENKDAYGCVVEIEKYLTGEFGYILNEEEQLYLILHINRLCARNEEV